MGGGYQQAPWVFKGRAIYQLQLVKSEEARKYIPPDFKLVDFFGYTIGGFYLARYEDSPVGAFDEFVALAGIVWNPPTSCAWAARVFVSNEEARNHGVQHVGLPSRFASFSLVDSLAASTSTSSSSNGGIASRPHGWWGKQPAGGQPTEAEVEIRNRERGARGLQLPVCNLRLPPVLTEGFLGPRMTLSLPSFSGATQAVPGLLKYACDLRTSIMPIAPVRVSLPDRGGDRSASAASSSSQGGGIDGGEVLDLVLSGKPLMALAFSDMVMTVEEPEPLTLAHGGQGSKHAAVAAAGVDGK